MEYFPKRLLAVESEILRNRIVAEISQRGYGFYALELKESGQFIDFTGFHDFEMEAEFFSGVEIGWRLARQYWGRSYASEAAAACLDYAREALPFSEVFSFTYVGNLRSEGVMQAEGMDKVGYFAHPNLSDEHPFRQYVLYHKILTKSAAIWRS